MYLRKAQRGSVMVEFALAGVAFIFIWIGISQMAIGMWRYHSLQYGVKLTGAYVSGHGVNCTLLPNSCGIQIQDAAQVLHRATLGIDSTAMNVTFTILGTDHTTEVSHISCRLDSCLTNTTAWPPAGHKSVGQEFSIKADYLFQSALAMVAPGAGGTVQFGTFHLPGYTHQMVQF